MSRTYAVTTQARTETRTTDTKRYTYAIVVGEKGTTSEHVARWSETLDAASRYATTLRNNAAKRNLTGYYVQILDAYEVETPKRATKTPTTSATEAVIATRAYANDPALAGPAREALAAALTAKPKKTPKKAPAASKKTPKKAPAVRVVRRQPELAGVTKTCETCRTERPATAFAGYWVDGVKERHATCRACEKAARAAKKTAAL